MPDVGLGIVYYVGEKHVRWLALIIALAWRSTLAQAVPTDEEAFAGVVAERVNRELPEYNVKPVGKLTLEGKRLDGESTGQLSLDRVYAFCSRNSSNCSAALDQYAKGVADAIKERNRPIEPSMVRVAVRPAAYVEQVRKQVAGSSGAIYARPVAPGLVAIPVLDFARSVRFVNDRDLEKLSLTEEELFKLGERNLRSAVKPLTEVAPTPVANSLGRISGEDYASSRVLFHSEWRDLSVKLNNKLVVTLPAPDMLLYGEGSTAASIDALRILAAETARKSSRPLSPLLLLWTEGGWEVLE